MYMRSPLVYMYHAVTFLSVLCRPPRLHPPPSPFSSKKMYNISLSFCFLFCFVYFTEPGTLKSLSASLRRCDWKSLPHRTHDFQRIATQYGALAWYALIYWAYYCDLSEHSVKLGIITNEQDDEASPFRVLATD